MCIEIFICQSNNLKTSTKPKLNIINWKSICFKARTDNEKYLLKQRLKGTFKPRHCFFIAITRGAHGPRVLSANSFLYESAGDQKSVKQQKGDNTFIDRTTPHMPLQLYSGMPEEENQNDCFLKSSHVPLSAGLVEMDKRANSANEISINKGSRELAWSLLQISSCSQPPCPAEMQWCPRNCSPRCSYSTYSKSLDFTPRMPGGRSVGATTGKTALQL